MTNTPLNPPDAPPAAPTIPEGLATKIGKYVPLILAILAALVEVFEIRVSEDTLKLLAAALAPLLVTQVGRYAQAAAIYRDAPSPAQDDLTGLADIDLGDAPDEKSLKAAYPADPPKDR